MRLGCDITATCGVSSGEGMARLNYGRFLALGLLLLTLAGCGGNKTGNNRDLITQGETEQNKKAAAQKRPDSIEKS